jgi:hypothetical protein
MGDNTVENARADDLEARLAAVEAELDRISPDWRETPASATV